MAKDERSGNPGLFDMAAASASSSFVQLTHFTKEAEMQITINGRSLTWDSGWITYEQIAATAKAKEPTVTGVYRNGADFVLQAGDSLSVFDGMIINAHNTGNA